MTLEQAAEVLIGLVDSELSQGQMRKEAQKIFAQIGLEQLEASISPKEPGVIRFNEVSTYAKDMSDAVDLPAIFFIAQEFAKVAKVTLHIRLRMQ